MKEMRRWLAMLLCVVMLIGIIPVNAIAAEDTVQETTIATEAAKTTAATSEPTETEAPSSEATEPEGTTPPSSEPTAPEGTTAPSSEPTGSTEPAVVAVTGITLDVTALEVCVGAEPVTLTATVTPEDATDKTVTWKSSDEEVATVDENGTVTFRMLGDAVITATAGEFSASCAVSVILDEEWITGYANEDVIDAAIFCSDVHGSSDDLTSVLGGVAKSGVDYSSIGFVGDTCLTVENTTSIVQSALKDTDIEVMFSYASSHDTEDGADIDENWDYSGEVEGVSENYLVYTIRETDMQNASDASTAAPAFTTWYNGLTAAEKALPIFIMSHRPLHARRNDNAGAPAWYSVISAAAETSDIVFFWAHNHTSESDVDTAAYYVAKDGTESFTVYNGDTVVPNFTYMNAGYINANNQNPGRINVATTVQITAGSLVFQDYDSSGAYSGTYAHNVTVDRDSASAEVTLSSIAISGTTEYYVGDELALTVTATYSDGTTADVTAEATLSGYDMSTAGTQTVTAAYGEKTATTSITVTAVQINSIAVTTQPTKLTYTTGEELDTTGMVVTATYNNGTTAEVTGWYVSAVDMTTAGQKEVTVNYMVDGITYKTTFAITVEEGVTEGVTLTSIEITKDPDKTEYLISQELALDGMVVVATFSDGSTKELAYKPFSTSAVYGGYELDNFSMYVEKAHELKVTYTFGEVTCTDSTTINVWNEDFTDENTGVKVHVADEDYGVTTLNVSPSGNTYVAAAVKDFIKDGTLVAYDITLTLDDDVNEAGEDVYSLSDGNKTVTLPIPEGVNNPVVYYVSDDGETVTNMNAVKDGSGNVTFTTTHFSTYVIGESAEITVPDPETATGSGSTTTKEEKEVYVLVSAPTAGNQYIIVNRNTAGSGYALKENTTTGSSITVNAAGNGISAPYIETTDETIMWNAASGMTFQSENGGYYLRYNSGLTFSTRSSTNWTVGTNSAYSYSNSRYRYLYNSNGTWTTSSSRNTSSSYNVYFYEKQTVEVETTTTVSGTYSIAGEDITKVVVEGTTADLKSTLTFTPTSGTVTTTDTSTTATYEIVTVDANGSTVNGDPNGIIEKIENGVVTFTGIYGEALVKVSYTTNFGVVTDYITVEAKAPYYTIDITDGSKPITDEEGNETGEYESVTSTIAIKGVTDSHLYNLNHVLTLVGADGEEILENEVTWSSSDTSIATVDSTGQVNFTGTGGTVHITVSYKIDENTSVEDTITITASKTNYYTPADGGDNFPAYPNEGSVRFDKTAQAVGNFSQTGMVQMELSMTGVPYTTENAMDVVVMLDMTGSMSDDGMEAAEEATKAFVETIVKNENGSYNDNRVAVYAFNSGDSSPYELFALNTISSDDELSAAGTSIDTASDKQASGGTPFNEAAKQCYDVLQAAKTDGIGDDRQQFCVFMSDGGPTDYYADDGDGTYTYVYGGNSSGTTNITTYLSGYASSDSSDWSFTLPTEYYTNLMKADGVTVYTVGLLLQTAPSNPSPYSSMTDSTYDSTTDSLTTIGSHYYFTSSILKQMATDESKYIDIFDVDNADNATAKFQAIASEILQAATDVLVTDKIADEYTMVFDIPTGSVDIDDTLSSQEFYIEVLSYGLDANHERTTSTSLMKLYLGQSNGAYYAASDASGTAYAAPVFEKTTLGTEATLYYWTTTDISGEAGYSGISVTVDGTTYYYRTDGKGEYNMTSGAYAYGTIDEATNTSEDLIIATPYFVYNADTRMLMWTAEKLSATELALTYFLYLDNSATEVSYPLETDPGTYPTNDYAYLIYTNYLDNRCYQEFPKPQMTWNGAQATYVFYLVNEAGQPVNKYGQVVDFANAVFVTAPVTKSVVWNELTDEGSAAFDVVVVAEEVLPDGYTIYDQEATYQVHVYEDETGALQNPNYFVISGSEENGSTSSTTKVYNTKAGTKYSAYDTYYSTDDGMDVFDFANTTVAFAVTWSAKLVPDAVVVDYGLPVGIDVLENDMVEATLNSISLAPYSNKVINTGIADSGFAQPAYGYLTLSNGDTAAVYGSEIYYSQKDMTFTQEATFYYDAAVTYYEGSNKQTGYLYSSVTVIPATTIYYEDSFVELKTFNTDGTEITSAWTTAGTTFTGADAVQDTDRPGTGLLDDADNLYGSDGAYKECSEYSLGSAAMITVDETKYGTAGFSFYGTGFDVISLTSNQTGNIVIKVTGGPDGINKYYFVDTYYGYARTQVDTDENGEPVYEWNIVKNDPNALYQVPVMKVSGLVYGQYNVTITASYVSEYDHNDTDSTTTEDSTSYDFYLDAIRIYDPAGNNESGIESNVVADAYVADHELYPDYYELRNWLIDANTFGSLNEDDVIDGIVFIDGATADGAGDTSSISDYNNFGPNNELYLAPGQAVSFILNAGANAPDGYEVDTVQIALKSVGGTAKSKIWDANASTVNTTTAKTISTATDMYYDITALNDKTVVIMNAGEDTDAILSITNVKVTYKAAAAATGYNLMTASEEENTEGSGVFTVDVASAETAVMSMRRIADEDIESTEPDETEAPETETTEPEESEIPETTVPEVTEPETTEPGESDDNTIVVETIKKVVQTVVNIISNIFSRWF